MKNYPNILDFEVAYRYLLPSPNHLAGRRSRWHAAPSPHGALSYPPKSARPWSGGNGRPPSPQGWPDVGRSSSYWPLAIRNPMWRRRSASNGPSSARGRGAFWPGASMAWPTPLVVVPRAGFPPEVAIHVGQLAGERPDTLGRSLSQGDGADLARQLSAAGM